jgi:hypothetical protein
VAVRCRTGAEVPSEEPAPSEAHPAATADDQMVEDLDAEEASGLGEPSGDTLVIT